MESIQKIANSQGMSDSKQTKIYLGMKKWTMKNLFSKRYWPLLQHSIEIMKFGVLISLSKKGLLVLKWVFNNFSNALSPETICKAVMLND